MKNYAGSPGSGSLKDRVGSLFSSDRIIWAIIALLFLVNIVNMIVVGPEFSIGSDDMAYAESGIAFKNTGVISVHEAYPTAQIMPGMPVLIGAVSAVFGEGTAFWIAVKLVMITFGSMAAYFIYKSVRVFRSPLCAAAAVLPLFKPDFLCINNQTLTEAPYVFFFTGLIYATLRIGQKRYGYCVLWTAMFMAALMFRANIISFPVFAVIYLLMKKTDLKKLAAAGCATLLVLACFVVPWSIRNYRYFNTFIPLTYGAGDALYLGTLQGIGYPEDEAMDYSGVTENVKEEYAGCYNADGQVAPEYARYVALETKGRMAKLRVRTWLRENPLQCILSFLVIKPAEMAVSIWHHGPGHRYIRWILTLLQVFNLALAALITFLSFRQKKLRAPAAFLMLFYVVTVYIHSMSYVSGRYNLSLLPALYILIGIGLPLLRPLAEKLKGIGRASER